MKKLILLIIGAYTSSNCLAQNVKALTIAYDITYPNKIPTLNAVYFKQCIMYAKQANILYKYYTAQDEIETSLTNDCNETTYNYSYFTGDILMKVAKDGIRSAFSKLGHGFVCEAPTVVITQETKMILGLKCRKVISEQKKGGAGNIQTLHSIYYIYDNLDSNYCSTVSIAGLGGMMFGCEPINYDRGVLLGAEIDLGQGCTQIWTAKLIGYENVDLSLYTLPQNLPIMTYDEYNEKVFTDKDFRKKIRKTNRADKTTEYNKQIWASLFKDLENTIVELSDAANQLNSMKQGINNYTKPTTNTINTNNQILQNTTPQINNAFGINVTKSESEAIINGSKKDGNSQEAAICTKQSKNDWYNTQEYQQYMKNQGCNKFAYISEKKLTEIMLSKCRQYLSQAEIEGFEKTISSLTSTINGMDDCKTYNYGK